MPEFESAILGGQGRGAVGQLDLVFTRSALLDRDLPDEVLGADFEKAWRDGLRDVSKLALARVGVTDDVAFMIDGSAEYQQEVSGALRTMSGLVSSSTSRQTYARHAGRFADWAVYERHPLGRIPPSALLAYKRRRLEITGVQDTSWNVEAAAIRKFLEAVALEEGDLSMSSSVTHPSLNWVEKSAGARPGEGPKFITGRQFRRFRDEGLLRSNYPLRNVAFSELLLSSGMRRSEGNAFRTDWLPSREKIESTPGNSLRHQVRRETAKGRKARWTRISKRALDSMLQYDAFERPDLLARRSASTSTAPDDRRLWLSQTGVPMSSSSWSYVFQEASERSKVHVTPHALRHSFAVFLLSRLISRIVGSVRERKREAKRLRDLFHTRPETIYDSLFGDPLRKVQKYLGHASYMTTFIYLDILAGDTLEEDDTWGVFSEILDTEADYTTQGGILMTQGVDDD